MFRGALLYSRALPAGMATFKVAGRTNSRRRWTRTTESMKVAESTRQIGSNNNGPDCSGLTAPSYPPEQNNRYKDSYAFITFFHLLHDLLASSHSLPLVILLLAARLPPSLILCCWQYVVRLTHASRTSCRQPSFSPKNPCPPQVRLASPSSATTTAILPTATATATGV